MFGSLGHSYNQHILLESILACSLLPHIFRLCSISTCRIRYIFHSYFIVCQGLISKYVFYICLYCMLITTALRLSAQWVQLALAYPPPTTTTAGIVNFLHYWLLTIPAVTVYLHVIVDLSHTGLIITVFIYYCVTRCIPYLVVLFIHAYTQTCIRSQISVISLYVITSYPIIHLFSALTICSSPLPLYIKNVQLSLASVGLSRRHSEGESSVCCPSLNHHLYEDR